MPISLYSINILRNTSKEIEGAIFDSTGKALIQFNQTDTVSLYLRIGESDSPGSVSTLLYLEPGTHIDLLFQNGDLTFQGDLYVINSYNYKLLKINSEQSDYINANTNKKIRQDSDKENEAYFSKIRSYGEQLSQNVITDQMLSNHYKKLLFNLNYSSELTLRLFLSIDKILTGLDVNEMNIVRYPVSSDISSEGRINGYLTQQNFYILWVRQSLGMKIKDLWGYYDDNRSRIKMAKYEYIKEAIRMDPKLIELRGFILALFITNISYWYNITYNDLLELVESFEKDYPRSRYLPELREILSEHDELRKGMPMKDFEMLDVNGKEFKLSNLKGSLIYIDVWATWCGPCLEELKLSTELSKKYANRPDLIFLYVSVDGNRELWMDFLKKNSSLMGLHGIQFKKNTSSELDDVRSLYKINGIPKYILIDKDGKIIDCNAAWPSKLLRNNYLDSLLSL